MITPETNTSPAAENAKLLRSTSTKPARKRNSTSSPRRASPKTQPAPRVHSKQARVLYMLRRAEGVTVATVMKATGWQKHSVHGFFAGVVRKKLGLKLISADRDGKRIYRTTSAKAAKSTKTGKPAGAAAAVRKQAVA